MRVALFVRDLELHLRLLDQRPEIRELAGGVLGHPERSSFDCAAEADVSVGLGRHERMVARLSA